MRPALPLALLLVSTGCGGPPPAPELLLLVTVDTLRADYLGAYGSDRGLTPALDALAGQSLVFDAAYAPTSFTLPSIAALLTGRYPEELGIARNESAVPASAPTLGAALRERGWRSAAVVSNFVLRGASGLDAGFDLYDDRLSERELTRHWPERAAPATTEAALRTLASCADGTGPACFLWVHYQDPHGPYTPSPEERARFLARERRLPGGRAELPVNSEHTGRGGIPAYQYVDGEREVAYYRAGYAAEIAAVDAGVGRLLQEVEARGLGTRSIVAFAADHGEGLGEDDYWFAHGELLTDPLVRVPLMLRVPGRPPGRRADLVSLVDLYPTLVRLATGRDAEGPLRGRDLLAEGAEQRPSAPYLATLSATEVPSYGLVEPEWKFIATLRDGVWDGRLYRRGREQADLAVGAPQVAGTMRRKLKALRDQLEPARETLQDLTPAELEHLRALGYASGAQEPGGRGRGAAEPVGRPARSGGSGRAQRRAARLRAGPRGRHAPCTPARGMDQPAVREIDPRIAELRLEEIERQARSGARDGGLTLREWVALAEAWRIVQALRSSRGNRSAAARELGIGRRTLYSKMEKLGLEPSWVLSRPQESEIDPR